MMGGFDISSILPMIMAMNGNGGNMQSLMSLMGNSKPSGTGGANTMSQMLPLLMSMMNGDAKQKQDEPQNGKSSNPMDGTLPEALIQLLNRKNSG